MKARRCFWCQRGHHPSCEDDPCVCECRTLNNRDKMLKRMQIHFTLPPKQYEEVVKAKGKGFQPMQDYRPHRPDLRSMRLCWQCDRETAGFITRRDDPYALPEAACRLHLMLAHGALRDMWFVLAPIEVINALYSGNDQVIGGHAKQQIEYYRRWNLATKNNPWGYMHSLTTPEQYQKYKGYYRRVYIKYVLARQAEQLERSA